MVEGTIWVVLVTSGHDAFADIGLDDDAVFRQALERAADWAEFAVAVAEQEPGPWRYDAACVGHGRTMFPERGESAAPAKALCAACPVLDECRTWGDAHEPLPLHGLLAGETVRERSRRRRTALSAA